MSPTASIEERVSSLESELAKLKQLVEVGTSAESALSTTPRNIGISKLGSEHPLAAQVGRLRNHPHLDDWREAIEEHRRELDVVEGVR